VVGTMSKFAAYAAHCQAVPQNAKVANWVPPDMRTGVLEVGRSLAAMHELS